MELNTKGRYAVMAMADLAKHGNDGALVSLSVIAQRQQISLSYLEQLFALLRRAGLVESLRGRAGGYRLAHPASQITVAAVMGAVNEDMQMTRCDGIRAGCIGDERCLTHELWNALGKRIATFLASVSLQDVLDGIPPDIHVAAPVAESAIAAGAGAE